MSGLDFTHAGQWPLLFLLIPLGWLLLSGLAGARRRARAYGARSGVADERPATPWPQMLLLVGATLFLLLTWMEPRLGEEQVTVERRGIDMIFCLDVSRSMLARDVEPDRLTRARRDIESAIQRLSGGDRMALVAFAGQARLVVPLTHDVDSFRTLLAQVDTDTVRVGGTDLALALKKALETADPEQATTTVFVLLTDGEDLGGAGLQAAQEVRGKDIVVHAIGYGSSLGAKILLESGAGQQFLRGKDGEEVVTSLDSDGLRALAHATGGEFLRADAVPLPLVELLNKRILPMEKRAYESGAETLPKTRFQWTLLPAVLLLLAELARLGGKRR